MVASVVAVFFIVLLLFSSEGVGLSVCVCVCVTNDVGMSMQFP